MNERLCGTQHSREGLSGLQFRPAAGKPEALPTDPTGGGAAAPPPNHHPRAASDALSESAIVTFETRH